MTQILKYDSISPYDAQFLTTYYTYSIIWFKEWLCTKKKNRECLFDKSIVYHFFHFVETE